MRKGNSRRSFIKEAGLLLGGLGVGVPTVSATESESRQIVDLRSTDEGALEGLTVVHHLPQIDLAVVRASEDELAGLDYSSDIDLELTEPKAAPYEGPTTLAEGQQHPNQADLDAEDGYTDALDEPLFNVQWDKQNQRAADVQRAYRGEDTRVAIIDSGVYDGHPNLEHAVNTELSKNFTVDDGDHNPNGAGDHGTHVAGIVAGNDQNGEGMVGMAPGTEIVACRVFSNEGASFGDVIAAMVHSADVGCDVANMSLGAYPLPQTPAVLQLKQQFERAAEYARSKGTLMIASAGNSGANLDAEKALSLPNEAEGIMSVAATGPIGYRWDDSGYNSWTSNPIESWGGLEEMDDALYNVSAEPSEPAVYTNYGAESTDISAPGGNYDEAIAGLYSGDNAVFENLWDWYYDLVLSTTVTETEDGYVADYGFKAGTSMAAPNAAGTAALVREAFPDLSAADLAAHLKATAADVGPEKFHGSGYLDTEAAVETTPEASDDD